MKQQRKRILIMGAGGRDFHNFNVFFRSHSQYEVIAFTATQIPFIDQKIYPPHLSGPLYPDGIPILPETNLYQLIQTHEVDQVVFAYSDISHEEVMHKASLVQALGSDFVLLGPKSTMLRSTKPIISVCATRTGCGKSQASRKIVQLLRDKKKRVVAIRHPMPYGDLERQSVQRFETLEDLKAQKCTIEEMEEYEPYLHIGAIVYAGVDYEAILHAAEKEAELIVWDGGNNDFPLYHSNLEIVILDAHRTGHELHYYPGETNFRRADVLVINKIDTANREDVLQLRKNIFEINPTATVIDAASPIFVDDFEQIYGKSVLVIGDGPTLTHGEMEYDAAGIAARKYGAKEVIDPRPFLKGSLLDTFKKYPHIGHVLPAMGYSPGQIHDLEATIESADCDLVLIGTPVDLTRLIKFNKPTLHVRYELQEIGVPTLSQVLEEFLAGKKWR